MSGLVVQDRAGRRIATITVGRTLLHAAVVLPVLAAAAATWASSPEGARAGAPLWPAAVLVVLALASAVAPDSGAPLLTLAALAAWWLVAVPDPGAGATMVVAGCALAFHLATALAATGPPGVVPSVGVVGRLLARALVLLSAAAALAALVAAVEDRADSPSLLVAATLLLAGALPWLVARR
ncbi:hypothetical protein HNR19_001363 [Nocardioides thalensis]|uniref:Uncharacterized protein n=1 Tax=Nocardioides thalensis TaxID=1914755 RepID=A0A853BZJ1_9ACTN|nr:hypothetical protein [Nocardioides thalensis]NYJ00665.1 hypothetical protein [Nocardioides thalensis]